MKKPLIAVLIAIPIIGAIAVAIATYCSSDIDWDEDMGW